MPSSSVPSRAWRLSALYLFARSGLETLRRRRLRGIRHNRGRHGCGLHTLALCRQPWAPLSTFILLFVGRHLFIARLQDRSVVFVPAGCRGRRRSGCGLHQLQRNLLVAHPVTLLVGAPAFALVRGRRQRRATDAHLCARVHDVGAALFGHVVSCRADGDDRQFRRCRAAGLTGWLPSFTTPARICGLRRYRRCLKSRRSPSIPSPSRYSCCPASPVSSSTRSPSPGAPGCAIRGADYRRLARGDFDCELVHVGQALADTILFSRVGSVSCRRPDAPLAAFPDPSFASSFDRVRVRLRSCDSGSRRLQDFGLASCGAPPSPLSSCGG